VWSGGGAVAEQCPVSTASGQHAAWLDLFALWNSGIVPTSAEWPAKDLDALAVLAHEAQQMEEREPDEDRSTPPL